MKKRNVFMTILLATMMQVTLPAFANELSQAYPVRIRTTAYTEGVGGVGHITASGEEVHEGLIATKAEYLGCDAYLYKDEVDEEGNHYPGELIGKFKCADTGGKAISKGNNVDVYKENYESCVEWMKYTNGYVWIKVITREER